MGILFVNGSGLSIEHGKLDRNRLLFSLGRTLEGQTVRMIFSGRIKGNAIEGFDKLG